MNPATATLPVKTSCQGLVRQPINEHPAGTRRRYCQYICPPSQCCQSPDGFDGADNTNSSQTSKKQNITVTDGTQYTIYHGTGGKYGGGGAGGGTSVSANGNFCYGGQGGVRIIWGGNRTFQTQHTDLPEEQGITV